MVCIRYTIGGIVYSMDLMIQYPPELNKIDQGHIIGIGTLHTAYFNKKINAAGVIKITYKHGTTICFKSKMVYFNKYSLVLKFQIE